MIQKLKYMYQFEPEVYDRKKDSLGERTGFRNSRSQTLN